MNTSHLRTHGRAALLSNDDRTVPATIMMTMMTFGLLMQAGCATPSRSRDDQAHHQQHARSDSARSPLATPPAIVSEHEHLHHQLDAAVASGGTTGQRAREVATILEQHFEQEEAYAMPPLGLLEPLAQNEAVDEATARQAIEMAERLRREYANMLHEHALLTEALRRLASAAQEEGKPDSAAFAMALISHAQHEEQVLYPATLVIGEYLELRQQAGEATQPGH